MATLEDVMGYLCSRYPVKHELSKARLTKMVYLADWKAVLEHGRPLTGIRWKFHHYGPWTDDVVAAARRSQHFTVEATENMYGDPKDVIALTSERSWPSLTPADTAVLDHVIEKTIPLHWDDFIRLVYSTFPIMASQRYEELDLVALAGRYRRELAALQERKRGA